MGEIYFKRVLEADDAIRLREVIEGLGVRAACEEMADGLIADALASVDDASIGVEGRARIREYIETLGWRSVHGVGYG